MYKCPKHWGEDPESSEVISSGICEAGGKVSKNAKVVEGSNIDVWSNGVGEEGRIVFLQRHQTDPEIKPKGGRGAITNGNLGNVPK
jgi:hypothetical protein